MIYCLLYSREELTSITQRALLKRTDYLDKMLQGYQSTPQVLPGQLHTSFFVGLGQKVSQRMMISGREKQVDSANV